MKADDSQETTAARTSTDAPQDALLPLPLDWRMMIVAFLIGVAVILLYRPWRQLETGDEAIWDYVAQAILRGQMPYRDVVEIKTPLSAYLSAMAMATGRIIHLNDILAVRFLNVLMVGLLSAVTCAVARDYLRNRFVAVLAFLIPLAPSHFGEWMTGGTEPKLPMLLFGMLTLLFVARNRPFWAGICSALAFLSWQPGLMFTGVALLIFSRYLTSWRDRRALNVLLGAIIPIAIIALYFAVRGAFGDLWQWTIHYNFSVYAPESAKGLGDALDLLWRVTLRVFRFDLLFVALAAFGFCGFIAQRLRGKRDFKRSLAADGLYLDALLMPPLIYLAFSLINFQSGPDLIPLFPFIGIFAAYLIGEALRLITTRPALASIASGRAEFALRAAVLVLLIGLMAFRAATAKYEYRLTLADQRREAAKLDAALGPDGKIYAHGMAEILVLLNRPNLNPYIFFDRGKDNVIAAKTPGGFPQVINDIEAQAPRIVALERLNKVAHRADLTNWVHHKYELMPGTALEDVYIRKDTVPPQHPDPVN